MFRVGMIVEWTDGGVTAQPVYTIIEVRPDRILIGWTNPRDNNEHLTHPYDYVHLKHMCDEGMVRIVYDGVPKLPEELFEI